MTTPVPADRVEIAAKYLQNADIAAIACREADIPYAVACALLEKESHGRNVYGHDVGGALSGYPREVDQSNYRVFEWLVFQQGWKSNGVGPTQITYKGYFPDMFIKGLNPWDPRDNMVYGFGILRGYKEQFGTWEKAAAAYNGGPSTPNAQYGADFMEKLKVWRDRFGF